MKATPLIPAAQYLRMSTEHQQYSMENQSAAIREYAHQHGFVITTTYEDAAKSGLTFTYRQGLRNLLQDVVGGSPGFRAILVYDVSRWGRFQDSDEAAHYEFLCKKSGVPVHYCAEPFLNDGSVPGSIMKARKRTMAGEYSRELSVKVYDAQRRLASLGKRLGGTAGYGYRRAEVSQDGTLRRELGFGDRRGSRNGRLALVLGPPDEVAWVKRIYAMFLEARGRIGPMNIAAKLNRRGIKYLDGRPWSNQAVRDMLSNPKYCGCAAWGRTTQRLKTKPRPTPKETWIAVDDAVPAIVDRKTFEKAQALLRKRVHWKFIPDRLLLRRLKEVIRRKRRVSKALLCGLNHAPCACTYFRRFGSLQRAYDLAGIRYSSDLFKTVETAQRTRHIREDLIETLLGMFPQALERFRPALRNGRDSLVLDGKHKLFVYVCPYYVTPFGKQGWFIRPVRRELGGVTLLCTLKPNNAEIDRFYVYPAFSVNCTDRYSFGLKDRILMESTRIESLRELCNVVRRLQGGHPIRIRYELKRHKGKGYVLDERL